MADKIKDAEDRLLETLFAAEPIADDGFSDRVVGKLRRRLWLRRLSLPIAAVLGGIIAFEPTAALVTFLAQLLSQAAPEQLLVESLDWLPPLNVIVSGGMILAAGIVGLRILED